MCKMLKDKEEVGYDHPRKSVRGPMITYQDEPRFKKSTLVSAVEGLIKYHEDKIETAFDVLKHGCDARESDTAYWTSVIENGYEDIMAIELWLEDAI